MPALFADRGVFGVVDQFAVCGELLSEEAELTVTLCNSRSELSNQESALFKRSVEFGCVARKVGPVRGSSVGQTLVDRGSIVGLPQAESKARPKSSNSSSVILADVGELLRYELGRSAMCSFIRCDPFFELSDFFFVGCQLCLMLQLKLIGFVFSAERIHFPDEQGQQNCWNPILEDFEPDRTKQRHEVSPLQWRHLFRDPGDFLRCR